MKRREFITLLGGAAAAWPLAARAQQPAMPVIGFLHSASPAALWRLRRRFPRWLERGGLRRRPKRRIEYRWAEDQRIDCRRSRPIWFAIRWR